MQIDRNRLSNNGMDLPEKLQKLFDAHRLSLRDVAALIGTSYGTVHRWVNAKGEPKLSQAAAIAELTGVPLAYLADPAQDEPVATTTERRQIDKWIARHGEEWALDRLASMPETPPVHAPRKQPMNFPPSSRIEGPDGRPSPTPIPATPAPPPAKESGKSRR